MNENHIKSIIMSSENTSATDSTLNTIANNINNDDDANVETSNDDLEAQKKVNDQNDRTLDYGEPKVKLEKIELLLVMVGLSLSVLLASLDQTIVATALPVIASDFKALDKITWVVTAYLLTSTAFQPTYGKFSDIFGRKATFLFAIIVFELGSLICGLSPNMTTMIIARAIAGVGGGGIIGLVMIIISDIVSLQDRGKYQGMIGAVFSAASVVGPLLGGAFTDHVSWRWSFYINLPLGAVTIGVVVFLLHMPRPKGSLSQKLKRIDYAGTTVIIGATVALLLSLSWGGNEYAWNSPIVIILLVVGGVGFLSFALIEAKISIEPIAPPHLFKHLNVVGCYATSFFVGMTFFALIYYVPLYFQVVEGDSATKSGLELIPYIFSVAIANIVMGQLVSRTDVVTYRLICAVGSVAMTVGVGLITLWDENTGRAAQIGYMIITGVGIGSIIQTTLLCAQGIVEIKDLATVTTLINFFMLIGAVFGVAIVGTIFSNDLIKYFAKASISPEYAVAVRQSATIVKQLPEEIRIPIINAYVKSLRSAFISIIPMGIMCFISSIFIGKQRPKIRKVETIVI